MYSYKNFGLPAIELPKLEPKTTISARFGHKKSIILNRKPIKDSSDFRTFFFVAGVNIQIVMVHLNKRNNFLNGREYIIRMHFTG